MDCIRVAVKFQYLLSYLFASIRCRYLRYLLGLGQKEPHCLLCGTKQLQNDPDTYLKRYFVGFANEGVSCLGWRACFMASDRTAPREADLCSVETGSLLRNSINKVRFATFSLTRLARTKIRIRSSTLALRNRVAGPLLRSAKFERILHMVP